MVLLMYRAAGAAYVADKGYGRCTFLVQSDRTVANPGAARCRRSSVGMAPNQQNQQEGKEQEGKEQEQNKQEQSAKTKTQKNNPSR